MAKKAAIAKNKTNMPRINSASLIGSGSMALMDDGIDVRRRTFFAMKAIKTFEPDTIFSNEPGLVVMTTKPTNQLR